jgi:4-amino-4-deoxy-L-arabinose transferase-like glycosyltransferase
VTLASTRVGAVPDQQPFAGPDPTVRPAPARTDGRFWLAVASAVALGAVIRFVYLFHGAPTLVLGDGFGYHFEAQRIADGLGYTSPLGDVGAESAHHSPGWATLLAGVTELGGDSMRVHQMVGTVIGLGVIAIAGLVGRRYAGARVGAIAALLAAVYPGFWVIEAQILAEPLALLIGGALTLILADHWDRPSLARAVVAGAVVAALALVRSEQALLFLVAIAPVLLLNRRMSRRMRLVSTAGAALVALVVTAPWTLYNLDRFEEPVVLSTNAGSTLIAGNCATTYGGDRMGFYDSDCGRSQLARLRGLDRSQADREFRSAALDNIRDNLDRMPATVLARYGRTLGVFRPSQTVGFVAGWFGSATWPVWAWITSFWLLLPLAAYGCLLMRRARAFQWPLVAPLVITLLTVTVAYGEPRYHTPADLGLVVLAGVALNRLVPLPGRPRQ